MDSLQRNRLKWNTVSSLSFQITTIICGFILPRLILKGYGSQVNGLVNSIAQFLHIIAFLELGVGAVVQSSLYKPLAKLDYDGISGIICSAERFFKKIAYILLGYIVVLVICYPILVDSSFEHIYSATLILAISISSFSQYYFGVVDRLLLNADQKGYIQYTAQTATLILNTIACAFLIHIGASIHFVKLTTSCIYLIRPIFLRAYVNRNYNINRKIQYSGEPIKQKWNGIAQHVAAVVLDQTDVIVLTVLSTLTNVSIYSVYHQVVYGVKNIFLSLTNGFQALMGELLAKEERDKLLDLFGWTEWLIHTGTTLVFGCTGMLIVPFVSVYTRGVNDADYVVPLFALLITVAHAGHCYRLPYNILILAAGHYKQTQKNYIIASLMNIVISVVTVKAWGLLGVALGTLCAMFYQTFWMAMYDAKHFFNSSLRNFLKHIFVNIIVWLLGVFSTYWIQIPVTGYLSWGLRALVVFLVWAGIELIINFILYREYVDRFYKMIFGKK